jgi:hypothetical protein
MDSGRDDHELAELRWVTAAEAGELMRDISDPVRQHLGRSLAAS